ncbi:MAG: GNAT family N-acetyltransferase [Acidobacteriota bacterium]|nr:GNAT family N-acetyltransferase [Acidobacteriota bacterium]
MRTRRARAEDVEAIARLIEHYAAEGLLLARSRDEIHARLDRFLVLVDDAKIAGCVALESYGPDLAEIRSIAIEPAAHGKGHGGRLLRAAMREARRRGYVRVFAVTHAADFFLRHGFETVDRRTLSEKIERDCAGCAQAAKCRLMGVVATVAVRPMILPVLAGEALPVLSS